MQELLECYIEMTFLTIESLHHLFCRKVFFSADQHCQFLDVSQSMSQSLTTSVVRSIVTDESFVDETRVWRKYKISILVSVMSLFVSFISILIG